MQFKRVTTLSAALLIAIVGIAVFFPGLSGQFLNDDNGQIVDNAQVHSIAYIGTFFDGTYNYAGGQHQLVGTYYRPLMMTTYSVLYSLFGNNPFPFHLLQLLLAILCAILLFTVLRYFFQPGVSLVLAIVYLIHPINSQAVFAIASLQEPLFMLFGLLAFWTLVRFADKPPKSRYALLTAALLLLSLLAKESGALFVLAVLGYSALINWGKWRRIYPVLTLSLAAAAVYLLLRVHAQGLPFNPHWGPIDSLNIAGRLMNAPAIVMFYMTKFVFPLSLAAFYHWAYPTFTIRHFLMPLAVDLAVTVLIAWVAFVLYRRPNNHRHFVLYTFFALWLLAGLAITLQVVPLDETVSETWFIFPMVGALGMIAVAYEVFVPRLPRWILVSTIVVIIGLLSIRTAVRGRDWASEVTLANADITVSKEDYPAYVQLATDKATTGDLAGALVDAQRAVAIFPDTQTYNALGFVLFQDGHYPQAAEALKEALKLGDSIAVYRLQALVSIYCGKPDQDKAIITNALNKYPTDGTLWLFSAVLDADQGDNADARIAIVNTYKYGVDTATFGPYEKYVYKNIMEGWAVTYPVDPRSL